MPVKYGIRTCFYITPANAADWLTYDPTDAEAVRSAKDAEEVGLDLDAPWYAVRDRRIEMGLPVDADVDEGVDVGLDRMPTVNGDQGGPCEPQIGDRVAYHGRDAIVSGILAERTLSPLTGNPRYRVVDFTSEIADEEAGRWVGIEEVISIHPSVDD